MFDPEVKLGKEESEADNFDIVLVSAEKIYILRPILRPGTLLALKNQMRIHCVELLSQIMNALIPEPLDEKDKEKKREQKRLLGDSSTLTWLQKYVETNTQGNSPVVDDTSPQPTVVPEKKITLNPKFNKRRLKREESGVDQVTKTWKQRNANRNDLVRKAGAVFDYIIDCSDDAVKISTILALLNDYEKEWSRFPRATASVKTTSVDKLNCYFAYSVMTK